MRMTEKNFIKISEEKLLSHQDVVFNAPVHDAINGMPIGNGDSGCLIWTEPDRLHISINKTDLWDDIGSIDECSCSKEEENTMVCRHGSHMTIDFGCPVFEMIYQNRYEGRISLYDATANISSDTPFCKTAITAFSSRDYDVSVIRANVEFDDDMPLNISLSRWGSRTFRMWYWFYKSGTHYGLDGTSVDICDGIMKINQKLNGTNFCVAVLPVCKADLDIVCAGSHNVRASSAGNKKHGITFYIAISTGETIEAAIKNACTRVKKASMVGFDTVYENHANHWADFWSKSFISLPEKNDYQENLWYLNLYYANSSMCGKAPAHFCNGIWNFYYDFVPWGFYFHYNMQLATFPLEAANHPELLDTYCNFRLNQLSLAKEYARKYKNTDGAFFTDVCDGFGRNADVECIDNCTCGAQLAMMLYNHYLYSGDVEYLKEKALPFMLEIAKFYLCIFKRDKDGKYHIYKTQGYEGSPLFDDSITDHSAIRALLLALGNILNENEFAKYKDILDNVAPYRTISMYEDEVSDGVFVRGIGKGEKVKGDKVFVVGIDSETGEFKRKTFGNPVHDYYGFPDTEMSTVFPSGIIGIKDKGTEEYNCVYNSICLHHPVTENDEEGSCMGWCMEPIYLARMGMSRLLQISVDSTINKWMSMFPQGFGCYSPIDIDKMTNRWMKNQIKNVETGESKSVSAWDFRHFDYETLPIIATATNEMLLQSYDGTVRLFCAVLSTEKYAFKLKAQNGFLVTAVYDCGTFDVQILSEYGGILNLAFENISEPPIFVDNVNVKKIKDIYTLSTKKGEIIRIHSTNIPNYSREYKRNTDAKTFGKAKLGEFGALN